MAGGYGELKRKRAGHESHIYLRSSKRGGGELAERVQKVQEEQMKIPRKSVGKLGRIQRNEGGFPKDVYFLDVSGGGVGGRQGRIEEGGKPGGGLS